MSLPKRLRVIGGTGSPYTQKMLALLRYRHIPFNIRWDHPDGPLDALGLEKPKPIFMPAVVFEDKNGGLKAECDSTPIIRHLESLYKGRLVLPTDPALAFIDYLLEVSPRAVAWVDQLVDQSDIDPQENDWLNLEDAPDSLRALLQEIGRVYVPAQLANARAVAAGEKTWEAQIDGVLWTQRAFPYQAKCLKWTNEIYQALSDTDRGRVDILLDGTGCDAMLRKA